MRTKFWQNYFLGKGFAKTSAYLFLNSDVANGKGGVWGGIFHLLLFLFWGNSGRTKNRKLRQSREQLSKGGFRIVIIHIFKYRIKISIFKFVSVFPELRYKFFFYNKF